MVLPHLGELSPNVPDFRPRIRLAIAHALHPHDAGMAWNDGKDTVESDDYWHLPDDTILEFEDFPFEDLSRIQVPTPEEYTALLAQVVELYMGEHGFKESDRAGIEESNKHAEEHEGAHWAAYTKYGVPASLGIQFYTEGKGVDFHAYTAFDGPIRKAHFASAAVKPFDPSQSDFTIARDMLGYDVSGPVEIQRLHDLAASIPPVPEGWKPNDAGLYVGSLIVPQAA